jgi:Mrp family chromosome partitioning ATPase
MIDDTAPRGRKTRLDPAARVRLLEEIARLDAAAGVVKPHPAPLPVPEREDVPREFLQKRDVWKNLETFAVDEALLNRNLVITASRENLAHAAFDVLRTRLLQALKDNGWSRVAITSPTQGCGKSFSTVNLALALSRYERFRTVVMDMDMRHPSMARYMGVKGTPPMGDFLRGAVPVEQFLRKPGQNMLNIGDNIAFGFNGRTEGYVSELFHDPVTAAVIEQMIADVEPDITIYDMPPVLAQDDVIAFKPYFDCIMLVTAGGLTTPRHMKETVRRLGEDKPVVGVILNKAEGADIFDYQY